MASGGRNLMSSKEPYIHSNYENFLREYSWGAGIGGTNKEYRSRLDREVEKLIALKEDLKNKTIEFLGSEPSRKGLRIKNFMVQALGAEESDAEFYSSVLKCIQSDDFYESLKNTIQGITHKAAKEMFGEGSEILNGIDEHTTDIIGALMGNLKEINFFEMSKKEQFSHFDKIIANKDIKKEIIAALTTSAGKIRTSTSKILKKRFKNAAIATNQSDGRTMGEFIIDYLNKNLNKYFNINDNTLFKEKKEKLFEAIKSNKRLSLSIPKLYKQKIGELRGEDLVEVTFNELTSTSDGVGLVYDLTATTTGGYSENITRKLVKGITSINIFRGKASGSSISKYTPGQLTGTTPSDIKASVKGNEKMARADLVVTSPITGRTVGVQSKNYRESIFGSTGEKINETIAIFSPHSKETIIEFVNRLEGYTGNDIDTESLTYALANMIWFSTAGSIERGESEDPQIITDPGMSELTAELSNYLVDLLGVSYSQVAVASSYKAKEVLSEISNVFYSINNEYMIPTYFIIEDLISIIKTDNEKIEKTDSFVSLSLTSSFSKIREEAQQAINLKKEKAEAAEEAGEVLDNNLLYSNPNLVEVGRNKGREIVGYFEKDGSFNLRQLFLSFDLNKLSAYNE